MALRQTDVDREIARAHSARRMLPWTVATAAGGAAIALAAGGGVSSAATLLAVGLVFTLFLWTVSVARCPACGAPLARRRGRPSPQGTGSAEAERIRSCPGCLERFE
jgi:hypothetical protein